MRPLTSLILCLASCQSLQGDMTTSETTTFASTALPTLPTAGTSTGTVDTESEGDVSIPCGMAMYEECGGDWSRCPPFSICQVSDQSTYLCTPLCSFKDGTCPSPVGSSFVPKCVSYQSSTVVGVCVLPCDEPESSFPTSCPDGTRCQHKTPDPADWFCSNFET